MRLSRLSMLLWMITQPANAGDGLEPPPGSELILQLGADGVQIYACEAKGDSYTWMFQAPEAALFDAHDRQVGSHGKGPMWTLFDGSTIIGEVTAKEPAPLASDIPWLLLGVKSHAGTGLLSNAAFIRRIDTKGGVAPATGCDGAHTGEVARMRYSATYQFFTR
jgi:hypothetical protein